MLSPLEDGNDIVTVIDRIGEMFSYNYDVECKSSFGFSNNEVI